MSDETMDDLFARAARERKFFHCAYQNLWFSPSQLRAEQAKGYFRWGAQNWTLRDPQEHIDALRKEAGDLMTEARRFEALING